MADEKQNVMKLVWSYLYCDKCKTEKYFKLVVNGEPNSGEAMKAYSEVQKHTMHPFISVTLQANTPEELEDLVSNINLSKDIVAKFLK
jgi:uncharacterized protein YuzB (UPF0349 family)